MISVVIIVEPPSPSRSPSVEIIEFLNNSVTLVGRVRTAQLIQL